MKLLIRLALILAGSTAIPAGLPAQTADGMAAAPPAPAALSSNSLGPKIQFNTENYIAGTNLPGDPFRCTFAATNIGDETLEITSVKGSCSCLVVGEGSARNAWTVQEIAPGQICRIPVEVSTTGLRGQLIRTVTVTSNDRTRTNVILQISGVVWLPIEVAPEMAVFSFKPDSTNLNTQVLRIFNRMATPLTLSDPQSSTNAFSAVLKTNVPGQEFELAISAAPPASLPPSLSPAVIQGVISLKSSATNQNPLTISVFETISPEVTVSPTTLQLPAGPLVQPSRSHVTIRDNVADLAVSDPAVNAPGVGVALTMMQTNRIYVVSVIFPRGFEVRGGQNVALTVKTDNPRFPTISVPIKPMAGVPQPAQPAAAVQPAQTSLLAPAGPRAGLAALVATTNSPLLPPSPPLRANALPP
jgi:hypothetical protein